MNTYLMQRTSLPVRKPKHTGAPLRCVASRNDIIAKPLATSKMTQIIQKPHLIFFLSIPIIILTGLLSGESTLDINIHDTYFIISYLDISILISIVFAIIGFGYWLMYKAQHKLINGLNFAHIVLTFGSLLFTYCISFFTKGYSEFPLFDDTPKLALAQSLTALLILLGLFVFLINIVISILKRKKTSG